MVGCNWGARDLKPESTHNEENLAEHGCPHRTRHSCLGRRSGGTALHQGAASGGRSDLRLERPLHRHQWRRLGLEICPMSSCRRPRAARSPPAASLSLLAVRLRPGDCLVAVAYAAFQRDQRTPMRCHYPKVSAATGAAWQATSGHWRDFQAGSKCDICQRLNGHRLSSLGTNRTVCADNQRLGRHG